MIAIIPARGGSKGLPGKNIKLLNGKPLIAYTIEAAQKAKFINRVIVSTDCRDIAEIAEEYGAEIPFMRPNRLATDQSMAIDTYLFTIQQLEQIEHKSINEIMVLLPTCPLRTSEDIDKAHNIFISKKADSVISYTPEHHPIYWHKYLTSDNRFENIFESTIANRQDMKTSYYPNGAIFIFRKDLLIRRLYYAENSFAYVMPRERSVDIDTIEDFEYIEFIMSKR
ncbi:MAG: acylneuraminate cytidylyltransferase family protein [Chitinophagales bacterium]|nr:acylneuraminate cytidylyltransferase family protein [Chitinophagales bacterium]